MSTIRVRALPAPKPGYAQIPMVAHVGQQARGVKQFVGMKHDATLGELFDHYQEQDDGSLKREKRMSGGFVSTSKPEEVDVTDPEHAKHYRDAIVDGDLLAADQETATWAGVKFNAETKDKPTGDKPTDAPDASSKKGG